MRCASAVFSKSDPPGGNGAGVADQFLDQQCCEQLPVELRPGAFVVVFGQMAQFGEELEALEDKFHLPSGAVRGRVRPDGPGNAQRADRGRGPGGDYGFEEGGIERGVVGLEGDSEIGECLEVGPDPVEGCRLAGDHRSGDVLDSGGLGRNRDSGVDQGVQEFVVAAALEINADDGDSDDTVGRRLQAGGFDVDDESSNCKQLQITNTPSLSVSVLTSHHLGAPEPVTRNAARTHSLSAMRMASPDGVAEVTFVDDCVTGEEECCGGGTRWATVMG